MDEPTAQVADPLNPPPAARVVRTPETCWGRPRIEGTRIKVEQVVVWHDRMGMTPAEIVERWPHLTLAGIQAALAYYREHSGEIDADLAENDERFEALKATQPSLLDRARRQTADVPDDQVPPR
jgi:uncharacterized protein (DUF433 family)